MAVGKKRPGKDRCVIGKASKTSDTVIGGLVLHRDGYGFVVSADKCSEDLFVPARYIGDALHTDLVEAVAVPGRGGKMEGRIRSIVERRMKMLMGRLESHGRGFVVVADDRRVKHRVEVASNKLGGAKHGDNVVVAIKTYPGGERPMMGEVELVLGKRGDVSTEKSAVIFKHQLVRDFPAEVEKEASLARQEFLRLDGKYGDRVDLRSIPFITIDGESAKDFDDAVAVRSEADDAITLFVSIADVSHFVVQNGILDDEAYARSTSVYFPADCIPMLPEALSNDACSLKPNEDRFTLTAQIKIDTEGNILSADFYESVIKSVERMTYTSMKKILIEKDEEILERYKGLLGEFKVMEECFKRLRQNRLARGTIDFDLPEPEIIIDMKGEVSNIVRAERHVGHMMIEEFMIAANEAVARFLTDMKSPCIYRVHETPPEEKLKEFGILMHNLGYKFRIRKDMKPADLAKIAAAVRGKPQERLVNHMLLRSMSQAIYSDKNAGHFGLASGCYCHFTSPIRRYPDLVVHRLVKSVIGISRRKEDFRKRGGMKRSNLAEICEHCSRRERMAMEAEREMAKLHACLFMRDMIGDEYDGIISHVTKFGFFVELIDYFVEGLVHISAMDDDIYSYHEQGMKFVGKKSGKVFAIGDKVCIEVEDVDVPNREVSFILL